MPERQEQDRPQADQDRPTLRVISGDASTEEIAAILALVAARGGAVAAEHARVEVADEWSAPGAGHRTVREDRRRGRHGWRTSFWPR